jgi:hypothetical protein
MRTLTCFHSRFQAVEKSSHSTGALYLTLCNNPRNIRFLREETELLMVLPGPTEPSLEEMNNVMDLFVDHMCALGKGMLKVYCLDLHHLMNDTLQGLNLEFMDIPAQ